MEETHQTNAILNNNLYYCTHLEENDYNLIESFIVKRPLGKGLERYLKKYALEDEKRRVAKTYLVKDCVTDELVGYFSLKAGMIVTNIKSRGFTKEFDSIPGIELANFAINDAYKEKYNASKLGEIVFVDFVLPIAQAASDLVGVRTLYLFSLPINNLINHYKTYGFVRLSDEDLGDITF